MEIWHREMIYLWYYFDVQLRQIIWYWVLGMAVGSAVSVFLKKQIHDAMRTLGQSQFGFLGICISRVLGIASPLCMYGTIPIAASFSKSGVRDDWLAAFMMSSILLNPQLTLYSAALGSTVLAVRIVSCFLCGIVAGVGVRWFYKGKAFFHFSGFEEPKNKDAASNILLRYVHNLWRNIKATAPYFLLGLILSAVFQRYVPAEVITGLFGGNEAWGVLMAATIGVPLYACGGGTIPLLQQWLWNGMSVGSAAAFMLTGPATKITNLGALKIVLGARRFFIYLAYIMLFSFAAGLFVHWVV